MSSSKSRKEERSEVFVTPVLKSWYLPMFICRCACDKYTTTLYKPLSNSPPHTYTFVCVFFHPCFSPISSSYQKVSAILLEGKELQLMWISLQKGSRMMSVLLAQTMTCSNNGQWRVLFEYGWRLHMAEGLVLFLTWFPHLIPHLISPSFFCVVFLFMYYVDKAND